MALLEKDGGVANLLVREIRGYYWENFDDMKTRFRLMARRRNMKDMIGSSGVSYLKDSLEMEIDDDTTADDVICFVLRFIDSL